MNKRSIEIQMVTSWPIQDIVELYQAGGWWKKTYDASQVPALIKGSFAFAVAVKDDKAVGMGRILSDGISDAYIQDVVVLPRFQHQGIGKRIIETLTQHCFSRGIHWIALIAEPGSKEFYQRLGFQVMTKYVPLRYQGEEEDVVSG